MSNSFEATRRALLEALSGVAFAGMPSDSVKDNGAFKPQRESNAGTYPFGRFYAFVTGTFVPAIVYQDAALSTAHDNPILADAHGVLPPIFLDPSMIYRFVMKSSNDANIPGFDFNLVSVSSLRDAAFFQEGAGAIARTVRVKLQDVSSVSDYGAKGDGRTQDKIAFANAAAALKNGGGLEVTAGTHLVGAQPFGPARGNVHAYDHAIIGTENIIGNSDFMGRLPTGWTLSNFQAQNPGIQHTKGISASAKYSISVHAYTTYLISIHINTKQRGGVAFFLADRPIFTEGDFSILALGEQVYQFAMFSYAAEGAVPFEIRFDVEWEGRVDRLDIVQVQQEAPFDLFSISSDKRTFDNVLGIKFGRFLSGNIAIGDRSTSNLLSGKAAWNVAVGARSLSSNIDSQENTAIGSFVLEYNQSDRNTAGGYSAFRYNTKGIQNTGWGYKTFGRNSIGSNNTGVGFWASMYNQTGNENSSFGSRSAYYNSHGCFNSAFGSQAGLQNDGGNANTFIGAIAGPYSPGSVTFSYSFSTCLGAESKGYGDNSTAVGCQARCGSDPHSGGSATMGAATAVGFRAVAEMDNGVALGGDASAQAIGCTALGSGAIAAESEGTAVGFHASASKCSTSIGSEAGVNLFGVNNVSIGNQANNYDKETSYKNAISIGYKSVCNDDDQITLGNREIKSIRAAVNSITSISDKRDKKNISYIDGEFAVNFLKSLSPARWDWNMRGLEREGGDIGFIAQDLLQAQASNNAEWLSLVDTRNPERLEASPGKLLPILVAALKEAVDRIEVLEGRR